MSTANPSNTLQVKRHLPASPACAFAAWTTPDQVKRWFGPGNCRTDEAQIDLRVGGTYRFRVFSEEMGEMAVTGQYREITAPTKLVFTWKWEDDEDWASLESVVTVEFVAKDGGTEVQITHEGFPSAESAGRHQHGWNGCLDKLQARSQIMAELFGPGRFSWNELLTTDVDAAGAFYTQLFGWKPVPMQAGPTAYTLLRQGHSDAGGMMKVPMPGMPPHWLAYVTVESADATAARIKELGGQVGVEPFDIPNVGRIAIALDPQGAKFGIFQPGMK